MTDTVSARLRRPLGNCARRVATPLLRSRLLGKGNSRCFLRMTSSQADLCTTEKECQKEDDTGQNGPGPGHGGQLTTEPRRLQLSKVVVSRPPAALALIGAYPSSTADYEHQSHPFTASMIFTISRYTFSSRRRRKACNQWTEESCTAGIPSKRSRRLFARLAGIV
jgi:hypothetical protein